MGAFLFHLSGLSVCALVKLLIEIIEKTVLKECFVSNKSVVHACTGPMSKREATILVSQFGFSVSVRKG